LADPVTCTERTATGARVNFKGGGQQPLQTTDSQSIEFHVERYNPEGVSMKHQKPIALAIACIGLTAAVGAQAQTNVTIYGRANLSIERTKVQGGVSKNEVVNNASRLGFRGTEDLGNGLSAFFTYEAGFTADGAGSTFTQRESFVGLKSSFGSIRAGGFISPLYFAVPDYISNHNHDTGNSSDALLYAPGYGGIRVPNSVAYTSPSVGGFQVQVHYAVPSEGPSDNTPAPAVRKDRHYSITGTYDAGPLHVGFGYGNTQVKGTTGPAPGVENRTDKDTVWTVGGLYNLNFLILGALYERAKSENSPRALGIAFDDTGSRTRNYWRVSAMMPVGAHEFHLNYGQAGDWSDVPVAGDNGGKQWTVAYGYNLSKRTKAYAFYTRLDNDADDNLYSFLAATPNGAYNSSISLGLRHNF
jgi:predicted porin